MTVAIEDKQNHARRAFEKALADKGKAQDHSREQPRLPKPPGMSLTPSKTLRKLGDQEASRQMARDKEPKSQSVQVAYEKAKLGLTNRTIKKDFDRAR